MKHVSTNWSEQLLALTSSRKGLLMVRVHKVGSRNPLVGQWKKITYEELIEKKKKKRDLGSSLDFELVSGSLRLVVCLNSHVSDILLYLPTERNKNIFI